MSMYEQIAVIRLKNMDVKVLEMQFRDIARDLLNDDCKILDLGGWGFDVVDMKIKFNGLKSDSIMKTLNKNFQDWKIIN